MPKRGMLEYQTCKAIKGKPNNIYLTSRAPVRKKRKKTNGAYGDNHKAKGKSHVNGKKNKTLYVENDRREVDCLAGMPSVPSKPI